APHARSGRTWPAAPAGSRERCPDGWGSLRLGCSCADPTPGVRQGAGAGPVRPGWPRRIGPMTDASPLPASGIDPAELAIALKVLAELDQVDQQHPDYLAVRRGTANMFKAVKRARRKEIRDAIAEADKAVVARTA